jgi:hypothetical protein
MPTKTKEYSLFSPGRLVTSTKDLFSTIPTDDPDTSDNQSVRSGTLGMIMEGPNEERRGQYRIQFLKNVVWWVNGSEIEPYIK